MEDESSLKEKLINIIKNRYKDGISFNSSTIMLLSSSVGKELDPDLIDSVKNDMFKRNDDLYFFIEEIADSNHIGEFKYIIKDYLNNYGTFELVSMFEYTKHLFNEHIISNVSDFKDYFNYHFGLKYRVTDSYGFTFVREKNITSKDSLLNTVLKIESVVLDECGGLISESDLPIWIYGHSSKMIRKIITAYSTKLSISEIGDSFCIQIDDNLDLPDDFNVLLTNVIEKIVGADLSPSEDVINVALSLEMGLNFRQEYKLSDSSSFKTIIERNYCGVVPRHWKYRIFEEGCD